MFEGFEEAPIYFSPTYKYDVGTQMFDTSEKCRSPAWCDRILYRGDDIFPLLYNAHMETVDSDHKPVSGWFSVVVKQQDMQKRLDQVGSIPFPLPSHHLTGSVNGRFKENSSRTDQRIQKGRGMHL